MPPIVIDASWQQLNVFQSKGTLVGHSDNNADEDIGYLHVTYANNHFYNVRSRGPLLRFGTAHVYK